MLNLPDSVFTVSSAGEDWEGLALKIQKENAPWSQNALYIIRNTPEWIVKNGKVVDGRKRQLQNLNGGKSWKYMLANHFDSLRSGALVVCEIRHIVPSVSPTDSLSLIQNQQGSEQDSLPQKDAQETAYQLQVYPGANAADAENAGDSCGYIQYCGLKSLLIEGICEYASFIFKVAD